MYYIVTDKNGEHPRAIVAVSADEAAKLYAQLVFEDSWPDEMEVRVWREARGGVEDEQAFSVEVEGFPEFTAKPKQ